MTDKITAPEEELELDLSPEEKDEEAAEGEGSGVEPKKGAKEEDNEEEGEGEDELPAARASFIIGRQKKTIEKLRSKKEDKEEDEEIDGIGDAEDEEITPAIQRAIARGIAEGIAPVTQSLATKADDNEIADLYADEPEARAFDKRIRAVMKMPGWEAVPVVAIYHHLSHKSAQKQGASKRSKADREAAHLRGAGHQRSPKKTSIKPSEWTPEDVDEMSDEQIVALGNRAMQNQR